MEMTVGLVSWYVFEEVVRASELLLVVHDSMHISYVCVGHHVSVQP